MPCSPLLVYAKADPAALAQYRPDLPKAVQQRLQAMLSPAAQARSLCGYWLLEQACALRGLPRPTLATLKRNSHGRPYLPDGPAFNISHSRNLAACVIAEDSRVGLDVEFERGIRLDRFRRFLTDAEWQACADDPRAFFTAWTTREAVVKATGRVGLSRIAQVLPEGDSAWLDDERLFLQHAFVEGGYRICLASSLALPPMEIRAL